MLIDNKYAYKYYLIRINCIKISFISFMCYDKDLY